MIFALLQEQHKSQMETMAAANQKAMDSMMEKMNAIIFSKTKPADKENTLPAASNAGSGTGGTKQTKKKCPHCVKHVSTDQWTAMNSRPTQENGGRDGSP